MLQRDSTLAGLAVAWVSASALGQCPPQRLLSPSSSAIDFGFVLAMNERHLIIGDYHESSMCMIDPTCSNGWAYAYRRTPEGGWQLAQSVLPVGLAEGWAYGSAIALDGDRAIITASLSPEGPGVGVPYVFEFDGDQWNQVDALFPPDARGIHGERLALHGDTALVGKAGEDVLVYRRDGGRWGVTHDLSSPDSPTTQSFFGWGMDLNDDWVVIGAPLERLIAVNGGAVYIYRRLPGGDLELGQKLVAPDVMVGPRFGESVAIDGGTLAVGGYLSDRAFPSQGAVYMYELVADHWELRQEITHARSETGDNLGRRVALSGHVLVAGAIRDRTPVSGGAAYLFRRYADGVWRQAAELFPGEPVFQYYGASVALADGMAAIGAPDAIVGADAPGAVDLFDLTCILCRADLDGDGSLTLFDFLAFGNLFSAGDLRADFDGDGTLTLFDFLTFQNAFDAGCR